MVESAALAAASIVGALAVGFGLQRFGGAEGRSWALPAGTAVVCGGLGHAFYLPSWLVVLVFFGALFFLHRSVKKRQIREVSGISDLDVPGTPLRLKRLPESGARDLGAWRLTNSSEPDARDPVVLRLHFEGEADDEYRVIVKGQITRFRHGALVAHHREAGGGARQALGDGVLVNGLPGESSDVCIRALPAEYAFDLLEIASLAAIQEIIALRADGREIYLQVGGRDVQLTSSASFTRRELETVLTRMAVIADRARFIGIESASENEGGLY